MNRTQFLEKWGDVIKGAPKKALLEIYKKATKDNLSAVEAYKISMKSMTWRELAKLYTKEARAFSKLFKQEEKAIEFIDDLKSLALVEAANLI